MNSSTILCFCLAAFMCLASFTGQSQSQDKLVNAQYEVELSNNASVVITHRQSGKKYRLNPQFTVMQRTDDPEIKFSWRSDKFAPNTGNDFLRLAYWKKEGSEAVTANFFETAVPKILTASSGKLTAEGIEWTFSEHDAGKLTATLSLKKDEPVITFKFIPNQDAYYSIGYTGMPEISPKKTDAIWQPYVWQEKRFPEKPFLSTEDMCGLPGTMVEKDGVTYGVLADPEIIPYRLPYQPLGNIMFGVLVRNQEGNAQPQIFAPVFGNKDSKLQAGEEFSFRFRVFMYEGNQPDAYIYAAEEIFDFKDHRENVYTNLNRTIENMIDFQMDDVYSRWSVEMKGFDYSTDVAHTVKNVSGLHPLSAAIITDNKGIYTRRALPIIAYLMSREKYLFSVRKNITQQQPSSRMMGPAVEVSELAALDIFYKGRSPVFSYFADSLSHTTRKLNLKKDSKGDDWPNLLSLYKMTGDEDYLTSAKQKADEYINRRITTKQTDFSESSTEMSAIFWTDFSPLWMELLNLYEVTREQRYLDAATAGAKLYMQYTWFYPVIPDSTILINPNGLSEFLCEEAVRDKIPPMPAPRQEVEAWRVSQIGLTPEATYTSSWNPAIFLANQAPHLLRLAHYTNDDFFRSVARSAVVGRYSNYPGYDINGEFNTVYARPDYPLRYQHEVSYNQFYYNHVWPQIAMLFDYLISDVYASSDGKINFPGAFAVGYAYLKSNVYGQSAGTFYEDKDVNLWIPRQVLKIDNEQVNYVTGYGNGKFYIALLNQSDEDLEVEVAVNPDLVPVNLSGTHSARLWRDNAAGPQTALKNGKVRVGVSAKGITALAIDDIAVVTQFQQNIMDYADNKSHEDSYRMIKTPFGMVRSAILSFGKLSDVFIWLEADNEQVEKAVLNYRIKGSEEWNTVEDVSYPFEFSVPLAEKDPAIEWWVEAKSIDDGTSNSEKIMLQK
ncbi:MAG: hypothetical protein WD555_06150 [Fulvivirga sp.]